MATKKPIVSIVLDEKLNSKLKELAKEKKLSFSKLVSNLLQEALFVEENFFKEEFYKKIEALEDHWKDKLPILFSKLLDTIPDPIWIKDNNLRYIYVNEAFAKLFKKNREDFIGKSDIEILPPDVAKECVFTDIQAIEKGETTYSIEKDKIDEKTEKIFEVIKTPLKDKKGNLIAILGFGRDITKMYKINEELEKRNKALEEAYNKLKKIYEYDYLTDFFNRGKFVEILDEELKKLRTQKEEEKKADTYLILMDICNLEHANELYGFLFGDKLIQEIATILKKISPALGEKVVFGRISGRSFGILLETDKDITNVISLIKESLSTVKVIIDSNIYKFSPKLFFVIRNISRDVPIFSAENLIFCMEGSMNEAKNSEDIKDYYIIENGRFSTEGELNSLVALLDKAVQEENVHIKIEEIYDTNTLQKEFVNIVGGIQGEKGFISIIDIYNSNIKGQNFLKLNQLFLRKVREEVYPTLSSKAFLDIGAFIIYDSISPNSEILKNILFIKDKTVFTICESVITNYKKSILQLGYDYNIKFAINNIGYGNTSLKNLMDFADLNLLTHIKFYPEIVKKAITSDKEKSFLKGIAEFCKGIGIKTVATEISTEEEFNLVRDLGIDLIQGEFVDKIRR